MSLHLERMCTYTPKMSITEILISQALCYIPQNNKTTYPSCGLAPLSSVADTEPRGSLSWKEDTITNFTGNSANLSANLEIAPTRLLRMTKIREQSVTSESNEPIYHKLLHSTKLNLPFLFRNNKI